MDHLKEAGWRIVSAARTASKEQGIDILATRDGVELVIEVKGYPSTRYMSGEKQGQPKPTQPTTQAKHWFSDALVSIVRRKDDHEIAELVIAFPDMPRYQKLVKSTRWALVRLGIGVYVVSESRVVRELMRPDRRNDPNIAGAKGLFPSAMAIGKTIARIVRNENIAGK